MASLDVESLFTNAPLDETIKICIDEIFKSEVTVFYLNKKEMFKMLSLTFKESIILFNKKYYNQIDRIAMDSPLGPTLASIFLCYYEINWLNDYLKDSRPVYYKICNEVDIFVLFDKLEHVQFFLEYIYKKDIDIKFSINNEINGLLSFLDVKIFRAIEKYGTNVFRNDLVGSLLISSVLLQLSTSLV